MPTPPRPPRPGRRLTTFALTSALISGAGCSPPSGQPDAAQPTSPSAAVDAAAPAISADAAPPRTASGERIYGQAGEVQMTLSDLQRAVEEAVVLQHWRAGRPPPASALDSARLRRRIAIQHLESRVVREEVARRDLSIAPEAIAALMADAAAGRPPGPTDRDLERGTPAPADLEARLVARYGVEPARVQAVATDLAYAYALTESLLDEISEDTLRATWQAQKTQLTVEEILIPRVPTGQEITEAVTAQAEALPGWYTRHPRLFKTPARRQVRVMVVPEEAGGRAQAETLRAKIAAGSPFSAIAIQWGGHASAQAGGEIRTLSEKSMPEAFAVEVGAVGPVYKGPKGWVIFQVERAFPEVLRPLTDERVRREIAAALLREQDALPHAASVAQRVISRLKEGASLEILAPLKGKERLRFKTPDPFAPLSDARVPGLGLAPEVAAAIKSAKAGDILGPFTVRQDYVVIRVAAREVPPLTEWAEAKAAFTAEWRRKVAPRAIEGWLDSHLKGKKLFVDQAALAALTLEELGRAPDEEAPAPGTP